MEVKIWNYENNINHGFMNAILQIRKKAENLKE